MTAGIFRSLGFGATGSSRGLVGSDFLLTVWATALPQDQAPDPPDFSGVWLATSPRSAGGENRPALFDTSTTVEISGRVTAFEFAAPHSYIHLSVVDEAGVETIWEVESYPPGMLVRKGLTPQNLEPGQEISATGIPSRDGRPLMRLLTITMPDGQQRQIQ